MSRPMNEVSPEKATERRRIALLDKVFLDRLGDTACEKTDRGRKSAAADGSSPWMRKKYGSLHSPGKNEKGGEVTASCAPEGADF